METGQGCDPLGLSPMRREVRCWPEVARCSAKVQDLKRTADFGLGFSIHDDKV